MITFNIKSCILEIGNKKIDFKHNLYDIKEINGMLIVLVDNPNSTKTIDQPINNVYAVDCCGNIVWEIKDIIPEDNLYTIIKSDKQNNLVVGDFNGIKYTVNLNTNTVISKNGYK